MLLMATSDWNTSGVTDMSNAFQDRTGFNEDISEWDTSSVINMMRMFSGATFNQPIGDNRCFIGYEHQRHF